MKNILCTARRRAFSLIEMMIVLGIVGLLLAFAAPNLFSLISSSTLSGEGTLLENQLTLAQQQAISKSADVEIRFFKLADESAAQVEEAYRAYQLFQFNPEGEMIPISTFFRIRPPAALHESLSTLLNPGRPSGDDKKYGFVSPQKGQYEAPSGPGGSKRLTDYIAFRFRPDGSTDLPFRSGDSRDTWYLTLVQGEGAMESSEPDNFVCLQVNPYNGQISNYRP
ncbi:MAG: Verru_Chthon cassette protein D [Verrucomicrobiales bacterium]|nr:Verru_Chthon cassette protein D [Verrucomicrobiales bacterium]